MAWAHRAGCIVFTHDLDFGAILASTNAGKPSAVQVRGQDVVPASLGETVVRLLRTHRPALDRGAIVTMDVDRARVRILPIIE